MLRKLVTAFALGFLVLVLAGSSVGAAVDAADLCKEKKAKAAGKKAFDLLKAFGKNQKKPNAAKLGSDVSKAQSKFTKGFIKAEGKGACQTSGDAQPVEEKVDAFVGDVIADSSPFIGDQRVIYSDGLHSENTEMIKLGSRILLAFRGGEEGQTGSAAAKIFIHESTDDGRTFTRISDLAMPDDPEDPDDDRDIRDPKFVQMGDKLFLYAISRLPGFSYRDLLQEAWTVRAESTDGGHTWTEPVKTFEDLSGPGGSEHFWGFWRFTKRQYEEGGNPKETLFATGYDDGDISVGFFSSEDGIAWTKRSVIIENYNDVPSEAELQFFGDNNETAVALVRMDNQGNLTDGQTAICTSTDPFDAWECGRRIEQRLDGPTWVVRREGEQIRNFVFARKHLPCTFKRTAAYELRGDLSDPGADIEVCEIQEVQSSGDTAYTALVPLDGDRSLLSWYSSPVDQELAWLEGQFSPSDIWLATVDFSSAPEGCVAAVPESPCEPPPLPDGTEVFDVTGQHLLSVSPVFWPPEFLFFRADVAVTGSTLDITLQPLEPETKDPVGGAWVVEDVPILGDGSFTADFGVRYIPPAAYPVLDLPIPLNVTDFQLIGKTTSVDSFCGNVSGFSQLLPPASDIILLYGSTFGAARITGPTLPEPVGACP